MDEDKITTTLDENVEIITGEDLDITLAGITIENGNIPEDAIEDGVVTPISC